MKKQFLSILCVVLTALAASVTVHASGFFVGVTPPGITAEPIVLRTEGGGYLTFDVAFDPLPDAAAAYTLILTTDAPGAEPVLIPLTYAPDGTSENLLSFSAGDSPEESISRGRVSGESLILLTSEFGAAGQEYFLVKETGSVP